MHTRPFVLVMFVIACFGSASLGVAESFDGSYVGERSLTRGDPSACVDKDAVSVTVPGGEKPGQWSVGTVLTQAALAQFSRRQQRLGFD